MIKTILMALSLLLPTAALSEVTYDGTTKTLRITGSTNMAQVVQASNFMREEDVQYIEMWGPGGQLEMGIQLGNRISREESATVIIPKSKACISACAFAAMGSDHIRIDGKLMLHRPFILGAPIMVPLEEVFAYMGEGYLMTAYYLEDQKYPRHIMRSIMKYTSPCKFMVYQAIEVKKPEDLRMWSSDDSRCQMMTLRGGR